MLDVKFNFSAKYEKELCKYDSCTSAVESQRHVMYCQAKLRSGKDIRTKLKLKKLSRIVSTYPSKSPGLTQHRGGACAATPFRHHGSYSLTHGLSFSVCLSYK